MHTSSTRQSRRLGLRLVFPAFALLAVSAFAALAMPVCSLAEVPTFNSVVSTPTGGQPWQPLMAAAIGGFNGDGKLDAMIAVGATNTFRDALRPIH